jgi:hypothetical protein
LKIKAIHNETKEIYLALDHDVSNIEIFQNLTKFKLIQWTGIFDLLNSEIYEGDKLQTNSQNEFSKFDTICVRWNNEKCSFELDCSIIKETGEIFSTFKELDCDVILDNNLFVFENIFT